MGVRYLSDAETGVVADMGGTTTDIAILHNGTPKVNPNGASVGKWRTSVQAADIQTSGLGGDSHITIDRENCINLNPRRVIPLSLAAMDYPEITKELNTLREIEWKSNMLPPTDFLVKIKDTGRNTLDENEMQICSALDGKPLSLFGMAKALKLMHPALLNTSRLEEFGILGRIGLTPTDILHADGSYSVWNTEAAKIAIEIYSKQLGVSVEDCIRQIKDRIIEKLSIEIFSKFLSEELEDSVSFDCKTCRLFLDKVLGKEIMPEIALDMSVKMPIIAIGAPVRAYFPPVVSKLKTQLIIPDHAEVANAIGAITGNIIESVEIIIEPIYTALGITGYTVHSSEERIEFDKLKDANIYAEETAKRLARERAIRAGADNQVEVKIEKKEQTAKAAEGHVEDNS
jgi:N-methylhydantoinase A/oxoprolinase/acetone carboxylase beta subunit